ncbi:NuA4-domain-containing protein [Marasmius fiardii PR-910]|nr:NuA4-domain-containing protein [Marasmius fiardii PR-910]
MADDDKARYIAVRKELLAAIPKKRALDKKLAQLEAQIYNLEGSYLTETSAHSGGNVLQGFDNYLKNQTTARRRYDVAEHDRLFSTSSSTFQKSLELMAEEEGTNEEFSKQPTPGVTTVIVPPATKTQELTTAQQNKLVRDKEYQRKRRASARKSVETGSDEESAASISTSSRRATKRQKMNEDE